MVEIILNKRTILTPNNLFYRLKDMMNKIWSDLPEDKWSGKDFWSKETEDAFNEFQKSFYNDLEKTKI
jgi:hypothetical protein